MEAEPVIEENVVRYKAPVMPAVAAMLYANSHFIFVPYWVITFFFYLVKSRLIYQGVGWLDWTFLAMWVPIEIINVYFARRMLRLMRNENFWPWVLTSICCLFFEIYAIVLAETTLYIEEILIIFVTIVQFILIVFGAIGAFYQSRPLRIQPE